MPTPTVKVEVGFASRPDDAQTWSDVTDYVCGERAIECSHGRTDEQSAISPGRASVLLDNADGRFSYGYASGAYYPNVQPGKRVRISVSPDSGVTWWPRFDGYVDGWPVAWGPNASTADVTVTATDRLARFATLRTLRDPLAEELGTAAYSGDVVVLGESVLDGTDVLAGGTVWLYGLQESSGSVTAGDVSGQPGRPTLTLSQIGSDGSVSFGTSGIMPEGTAVTFSPASAGNGLTLGSSTLQSYIGTEFTLWAQFAWEGTGGIRIAQVGGTSMGSIALDGTSTTVTAVMTAVDGSTATATKTVTTNDNAPHLALVSVSGTTLSLYVDDNSAATATVPAAGLGMAQGLTIGGTTSADPCQVAWVGFAGQSTTATRAAELAALACGDAERSDLRVARILRWLGLTPDAALDTGQSSIAYQAAGGRSGLDLIGELQAVEQGAFFADGQGRFVFQSRSRRYNVAADVTLDSTQFIVDSVAVDTTRLLNDYSASRPRGATYRAINQTSVNTYGIRAASATLYAASDSDLRTATDWHVQRYGVVAPRIPQVTVDMLALDAAAAAAVLGLDIGSRVRLTDLPTTNPGGATTIDLWVEGVTERVGVHEWTVTLATSPTGLGVDSAWTLDSTTYGVLGTSTVLAY